MTFHFFIWMPGTWMWSVSKKTESCTFMYTILYTDFGKKWSKKKKMNLTSRLFLSIIILHAISLICYIRNKNEKNQWWEHREVQTLWMVLHGLCIMHSSEIPNLWHLFMFHCWNNLTVVDFLLNSKYILTTKALGRS